MISLRELTSLFTGLFAGSNPRKIDGGATLTCAPVAVAHDVVAAVIVAASAARRRVIIQNEGANIVAVGPDGVTTATGHILAAGTDGAGGTTTLFTRDAVYARSAVGASEVRVLVEAD